MDLSSGWLCCLTIQPSCSLIWKDKCPFVSTMIPHNQPSPVRKLRIFTVSPTCRARLLALWSWLNLWVYCFFCTLLLMSGIIKSKQEWRCWPIIISAGEIPVVEWEVTRYCNKKHDTLASIESSFIVFKGLYWSRMVRCWPHMVDAILFSECVKFIAGEYSAIACYQHLW